MIVTVEIRLDPGDRTRVGLLMDIASPRAVGEENPVTLTVPVNPRLVKVTVKVVEPPATKLAGEGVPATIEKSPVTITATDVLCVIEPAVSPRLVVLNEKESPVIDGALRLTVPVNPKLVTVMMDLVDPLATKLLGLAGEAVMVRSPPTLTETRIE